MKFWSVMIILMFLIWSFTLGAWFADRNATRRYEQKVTTLTFASVFEHSPVTIAYNESVTIHLGSFIKVKDEDFYRNIGDGKYYIRVEEESK